MARGRLIVFERRRRQRRTAEARTQSADERDDNQAADGWADEGHLLKYYDSKRPAARPFGPTLRRCNFDAGNSFGPFLTVNPPRSATLGALAAGTGRPTLQHAAVNAAQALRRAPDVTRPAPAHCGVDAHFVRQGTSVA